MQGLFINFDDISMDLILPKCSSWIIQVALDVRITFNSLFYTFSEPAL